MSRRYELLTGRLIPTASIWRPIVSGDQCDDCGALGNTEHAPGCPEGEEIMRECMIDERTERMIDDARDE